jgi:hypothetical protein
MKKKSLYDAATSRVEKINYLGFNYEGKILKRTLSSYLFRDPNRAEILQKFEEIIYFLVEKVKTIKTFYNYSVPKDYNKIN